MPTLYNNPHIIAAVGNLSTDLQDGINLEPNAIPGIRTTTARKVACFTIEDDNTYFNTKEQITRRGQQYFSEKADIKFCVDKSKIPTDPTERIKFFDSLLRGEIEESTASGFFSKSKGIRKSKTHNSRLYLSASNSVDAHRTGVEINSIEHWVAGTVKISAGTPGHIIEPLCFGVNEAAVVNSDAIYKEIDLFNPVNFILIQTGEDVFIDDLITFPIITSDNDQSENFLLNSTIEPFPIRSVISNFSINTPFEPHSMRAGFGNGNTNSHGYRGSDQVLSLDEVSYPKTRESYYLDAGESVSMENSEGNVAVDFGPIAGYFNVNLEFVPPFDDAVMPRGQSKNDVQKYDAEMWNVIKNMPSLGTTYMSAKQATGRTGFMYDTATQGTDSVAFGGMLY